MPSAFLWRHCALASTMHLVLPSRLLTACRAVLHEGDIMAAAEAFRDARGPASVPAGNELLEAAAKHDKLTYTSVYRCCDLVLEQHRQRAPPVRPA
jgi:hypothetical protein